MAVSAKPGIYDGTRSARLLPSSAATPPCSTFIARPRTVSCAAAAAAFTTGFTMYGLRIGRHPGDCHWWRHGRGGGAFEEKWAGQNLTLIDGQLTYIVKRTSESISYFARTASKMDSWKPANMKKANKPGGIGEKLMG